MCNHAKFYPAKALQYLSNMRAWAVLGDSFAHRYNPRAVAPSNVTVEFNVSTNEYRLSDNSLGILFSLSFLASASRRSIAAGYVLFSSSVVHYVNENNATYVSFYLIHARVTITTSSLRLLITTVKCSFLAQSSIYGLRENTLRT